MDEIKNKKVLLMTVGTGDKGSDIAHGLFFSIKDSNPDILILMGSQKSFDITLNYLKELISKEKINCKIEEKVVSDINDFEILHFEFSNVINELLQKGYSLNKISVDYTSGTKAMSAALVSAALFHKIGSITYIYGERGEGGRVKTGTERKSSLAPSKIFSNENFCKAIEYFNAFRFTTCYEILNNFEFHPEYSEKISLLKHLTLLFDNWDKFNFSNAFELLKKIDSDLLKIFELKNKFDSYYRPLLVKLNSKEDNYEKLLDLIGNADRRASEGRYDDAIARLYRAMELLGQIEFKKQFDCSTSDVKIENIPAVLQEEIQQSYYDSKDNKIKIPLFGTFEILSKTNNEVGVKFIQKKDDIKQFLILRNNSILAHGFSSINKENFEHARKILKEFLEELNVEFNPTVFPKLKC